MSVPQPVAYIYLIRNKVKELVRQGKAERVQVGERWHYHIYEVKR